MAEDKKSIFDLIDKFGGYDGSFKNDWAKKDFKGISPTQTTKEEVTLNTNSKIGSGFVNTNDKDGKLLKLGFMQADVAVRNVKAKALKVVQIVYFIPNPSLSKQYGKNVTIGEVTYKGFVDGGRNSPEVLNRGEVGDSKKPYLYGPKMETQKKEYESWDGSSGNITATDEPFSAFNYKEIFFETYFVASDYNGKTTDKILAKVNWGFNNFGASPKHYSKVNLIVTNSLSATAVTIIKNDGYTYNTVK